MNLDVCVNDPREPFRSFLKVPPTYSSGIVAIAFFVLAGWFAPMGAWGTTLEDGDAAWRQRADGYFETSQLSAEPIDRAIASYEAYLREHPESFEARFRLMDAIYFKIYFVEPGPDELLRLADRTIEVSESTVRMLEKKVANPKRFKSLSMEEQAALLAEIPEAPQAYYWAAVNWGLWAMAHGLLDAVRVNIAERMRSNAAMLIQIDPEFWDGAGYRVMGQLNMKAPYVPIYLDWVDRKRGIRLLEKATAQSTTDVRNPFFLAEALLEHAPARKAEALRLLTEIVNTVPNPERPIEQSQHIELARQKLHELVPN